LYQKSLRLIKIKALMIKINVITNNNNWFRFIKNPDNYLDRKIKKLNSKENKLKNRILFFTLLLSDNNEIRKLNKKFRKKNKATDVLSFPFQSKSELEKKLKKKEEIYLGDIIINLDKIKSRNFFKDFQIKFDRLWLHGFVHLFGHDHKKNKDFVKMNKIEKKYFNIIND